MTEFLLQKFPVYFGFCLVAGGLAFFFARKYVSQSRDDAFRKEATQLLDALDADRRMHAKMYSVHREIERRNIFDNSTEKKESSERRRPILD